MNRFAFVVGVMTVGGSLGITLPSASAVELPCRTARLIVPYAPGGGTDIIFRLFVNAVNEAGAVPSLQVVNIDGQSGMLGAKEVAAAAPDGCTLLAHHEALITNFVSGQSDLSWDTFEPVANLAYTPYVLGARGKAPFDNVGELVAAAKEAPGSISVGVGIASTSHFLTLILENQTGIKLNNIPYDGTREKVTALLSDTVDLAALDVISSKSYLSDGSIKLLATATGERDPLIPDVPTFTEQGIDLIYGLNRGIYLPKDTPDDVVAYWDSIFAKAAQNPSLAPDLENFGTLVQYGSAADLRSIMNEQTEVFSKIAEDVGLKQ